MAIELPIIRFRADVTDSNVGERAGGLTHGAQLTGKLWVDYDGHLVDEPTGVGQPVTIRSGWSMANGDWLIVRKEISPTGDDTLLLMRPQGAGLGITMFPNALINSKTKWIAFRQVPVSSVGGRTPVENTASTGGSTPQQDSNDPITTPDDPMPTPAGPAATVAWYLSPVVQGVGFAVMLVAFIGFAYRWNRGRKKNTAE